MLKTISFDTSGKPLSVSIEFPTRQVVSYTLTLFEAKTNSVVMRETGNNRNPEDDKYLLPTPTSVNKGRFLQFGATFIREPGTDSGVAALDSGQFEIDAVNRDADGHLDDNCEWS